ncbi:MAG: hypothetical protein V3R86_07115 [Candidatus Hydrothermarchaeaceae archaeon]
MKTAKVETRRIGSSTLKTQVATRELHDEKIEENRFLEHKKRRLEEILQLISDLEEKHLWAKKVTGSEEV